MASTESPAKHVSMSSRWSSTSLALSVDACVGIMVVIPRHHLLAASAQQRKKLGGRLCMHWNKKVVCMLQHVIARACCRDPRNEKGRRWTANSSIQGGVPPQANIWQVDRKAHSRERVSSRTGR